MRTEGCVYLLQEKKPEKLLGYTFGWIEESGFSWIKLNFSDLMNSLKLTTTDNRICLTLSFEIALSVAGWFLSLVNQNRAFLSQRGIKKVSYADFDSIGGSYHNREIEIFFNLNENDIKVQKADGDIEIIFREDIAEAISFTLFEQLGQCMADTANSMLEDA